MRLGGTGIMLLMVGGPLPETLPPLPPPRARSSVVHVAWALWVTRARAASRPGPAAARPTALATPTLTVS